MANQKTKNKQQAKRVAVSWTDHAWDEYLEWQKQDQKIVEEINDLIEECRRDPFKGTGKPEPLKGDLSGFWSRRITKEHRLVYLPEDNTIYVVQCKWHY
jgi:toxin YoeB